MQLGKFSISLAVKDLEASRVFYEALGFQKVGGEASQNWLILANEGTTIGLFQGMFDRNTLTFNPGWGDGAQALPEFTDVRELQAALEAKGIEIAQRAEGDAGPAWCMIKDPDGNPILLDQHV